MSRFNNHLGMTSNQEQRKLRSDSYSVVDVILSLNNRAPLGTAEEWDNVGLLVGDPSHKVTGIVLSIDLNAEVLKFAKSKKCNLIINHHPFLFPKGKGPSSILAGSFAFEAIQNGMHSTSAWCYSRCSWICQTSFRKRSEFSYG